MRIGITGGIASGKSQVKKILESKNYTVIDCDLISHKILGKVTTELLNHFGSIVVHDNGIDRTALGKIVFEDCLEKEYLNSLVHPLVKEEVEKQINECNDKIVFIDIPLLFEVQWESMVDKTVLVYCSNDIQIERLMKRDNIDKSYAQTKINAQFSLDEKVKLADYIIKNNSTLKELEEEVNEFIRRIEHEI